MKNPFLLTTVLLITLLWFLTGPMTVNAWLYRSLPQHIIDIGEEDNELIQKGVLDVTLYNGWDGNPVDPTGQVDSTVAIQKAIDDARERQLVAFFPHQSNGERGIYLISETIDCRMRSYGMESGKRSNVIIGSKKGGIRPLIKLIPGSSGFQDINDPQPMFWFWSQCGHWEVAAHPGCDTTDDPWDNDMDISFDQVFRGIDLDLGGNIGAIGIKNPGAQGQAIENVVINATYAFAGIGNLGGLGSGEYDVEIIGGRYGLYIDTYDRNISHYSGKITLVGSTFRDQEYAVIRIVGRQPSPIAMVGFHIVNSGAVPFNIGRLYNNRGGIVLVDGIIDVGGGELIDRGDNGLFMRNIYVRGADSIVDGWSIDNKDDWTWIKEYSIPSGSYENLVEGDNNGLEYKFKEEDFTYTEEQLVSSLVRKHQWDEATFPSFEDTDLFNVKDFGAQGDGVTDNTDAINDAIAAADAGSNKVFFPKGEYMITETIVMNADTQLFGVSKTNTIIAPHSSWTPAVETMMLSTEDSAGGTAILSDILIGNPYDIALNQFRFTPIEWRVGRNSVLRDVISGTAGNWVPTDEIMNDYHRFRVNGHGGGRWFSTLGRWIVYSPDSRGLLIEDTDEPMYIYPCNYAKDPMDTVVEIKNSNNKFFYYPAFEGGKTIFRISDSGNITIFASHKNNLPNREEGRGIVEVINSDNISVSMANSRSEAIVDEIHLLESYEGSTYTIESANIALFRRGDPGYTPIITATPGCGDGTCDMGECDSCPQDCTLSHCCGIEGCNPSVGEDCSSCSQDCGACQVVSTFSFRTQSVVSIDGDPSEWADIAGYHVPYTSWVSASPEPPGDSQDCSAVFKSMWNDTHFFAMVNVTDESIHQDSDRLHNDDSVELYLDGGNEKAGTYDNNDFQLTVDTNNDFEGIRSDQLTFEHAAVVAAGSYIIEYAVPFSALEATPADGTVMGFDVAVNDDDDGGDTRESQIVWHGDGTGWQDPSQMGEIGLKVAHRADNNPRDGCILINELGPAIDDWKYDSTTNPMWEVMEAVTLWSRGTGCVS